MVAARSIGLAIPECPIHVGHMGNIIAFILGLISLVIVIPATIPFLGWANWLALPLIVIGIIAGQLSSSSKAGRNFCLIVLLVAVVRLSLGGGVI
ncbi:hypothetical protein A6F68_01831 [Tsuneonella dongtanensis]|uniref:Uncharacterized protein n=2 Tax=Tsuneonella dongtanensis TaxID=692370 RepID=A0A1B2AE18_9SPHN|nr:hypothetical protein A6F68_01831 [Tsuneonella dongtanensis]